MRIRWEAAWRSDVGRVRQGNEDAVFVDAAHGVFLVADGMGGHAAGEVASALAAEASAKILVGAAESTTAADELRRALREGFHAAQERIIHSGSENPRTQGMGTTLTACLLAPDGSYLIGHVGDSRAYRLRDGHLEQLTSDHTWVQREIDAGRLSPTAARAHPYAHVLTRVLSTGIVEEPDLLAGTVEPGDVLLLCTDGLTGMLEDGEIAGILGGDQPLPALLEDLIGATNARGGADNVSVVVVRVGAG